VVTACNQPSHRIKHELKKGDETVTCFEPPPDLVTAINIEAQVKNVTDLLKGSMSIEQTYQRIRSEIPNLQAVETILFRLCVDYANGALSSGEYIEARKILRLLDNNPSHLVSGNKPSTDTRVHQNSEKIVSRRPNVPKVSKTPKVSPKVEEPFVDRDVIHEKTVFGVKDKILGQLKPIYSPEWTRYGQNNRGVRIEQHGTSMKLSFSGKGNGSKNVGYSQIVRVLDFENLIFETKFNISDDEGIGIPVARIEFLDEAARVLFHIAMTPNGFYQSKGLYARYPVEYGKTISTKINLTREIKEHLSSENRARMKALRVSYEITTPKMYRCRRCSIEVFDLSLYSE